MKKILCIFLSLLLTADMLTACGQESYDDGFPVLTLALREGIYANVVRECVKSFEKENKVHCKILGMSEDDLHTKVLEDTKGAYDLCMVDGSWMAEYTYHNVLANLSGLGYELDEDIISGTTKVCYSGGDVYLAPFYGNVTVLLYNKFVIEKAGYRSPEEIDSLNDVLKICKYARKRGIYGFMYRGDTTNNYVVDFLPILLSFGGWVVDEENHPTVNTLEFQRAMHFYLELIDTGTDETRDNLTMAIANNAAAMAVGWPGWYTPSEDSMADYCAFSGKYASGSEAYNANVYGIWTLGIPANATQKELSIQLLQYLMDAKVQKQTVSYGGVPCRYSSLKDADILKKFPQYQEVCDALENGVYRPIMVEWPQFYEILGNEMDQIIHGTKSVQKGLSDAQKQLEQGGN